MPRGGHNKKREPVQSGPSALVRWPKAPEEFTEGEVKSWSRIGRAVMEAGSVGPGDLVLAERLAQLHARVSLAMADPDTAMASLAATMRLEADLLNRMGLTPLARRSIGPLSKPKKGGGPLDEF
jgi:hypothetical protein